MSDSYEFAKDVPPTSLESKEEVREYTLEEIDKLLLSSLKYDDGVLYKTGQAKQGKKQSTSLNILRDALYKEIEDLKLTKEADKTERAVNTTTKKILQHQIDNVLNLLEMSINKTDNRYYILGLIIKALYKK